MKLIFILGGLAIGVLSGLLPHFLKPRPLFWKVATLAGLLILLVYTLAPPVSGTFSDARYYAKMSAAKGVSVLLAPAPKSERDEVNGEISLEFSEDCDCDDPGEIARIWNIPRPAADKILSREDSDFLISIRYDLETDKYVFDRIVARNPILTMPLVRGYRIGFEERIRTMAFHIPSAWTAVLAFLVSMVYSIKYLRKNRAEFDVIASSSAAIGLLFSLLATVSGMIWAKFDWGSFWNWDPRETSIFILLLIYGAYFSLRQALDDPEKRAKASSVYSIIAFVTVPFLIFALPRLSAGAHPGSVEAGPVLNADKSSLIPFLQVAFGLGMAVFGMLFFWILNLASRVNLVKLKIDRIDD